MDIGGKEYDRAALLQRIGNLAQLGGARQVILNEGAAKGVAAVDVDTGAGLRFTVLPDRAMDISSASYKGLNLVYLTPNGEVHPAFYDPSGLEWLKTFFGGLLTTCGLTYLGPPGADGDDELGLHGRYSAIPARQVQDRSRWEGDAYLIELVGTVEECRLFGDNVRLTRTISTEIGSRRLLMRDEAENVGYSSSPFTILYHINAGFPLLDACSELVVTAAESQANNEGSQAAFGQLNRFSDPIPGFEEQNFTHTVAAGDDGMACAAMLNRELGGGIGLAIRFDPATLPYLNEWKMMGQRDYVVGIEPCNAPCAHRADLRERGLLPMLEPGEKRRMTVEIGVLEGLEEIEACRSGCNCRAE